MTRQRYFAFIGLLLLAEMFIRYPFVDASIIDIINLFESIKFHEFHADIQKFKDAETCIATYKLKNPENDAKKNAANGDLRFYYANFNGYASGVYTPGIRYCGPDNDEYNNKSGNFNNIGNPAQGDGLNYDIIKKCNSLMSDYAVKYNQKLATIAPNAMTLYCHDKKPPVITDDYDHTGIFR